MRKFLFLEIVFIFISINVIPAPNPVIPETAVTAKKKTQKIDDFFNKLAKTDSLGGLIRSVRNTRYSQAEIDQVIKRLQKDGRAEQKLKRLVKRSGVLRGRNEEIRTRIREVKGSRNPVFLQKKRKIKQNQERRLARKNGRARSLLARQRSIPEKNEKPSTLEVVNLSPSQFNNLMTVDPGGRTDAHIHSLNPQPVTVGRSLAVAGRNFGASWGSVALIIGGFLNMSGERNLIYCPLSRWDDQKIVALIPEEVQEYVGESEKDGVVWVKLHGGEIGPTKTTKIEPDYSQMTPEISTVSSEDITPGQTLTIVGSHFLTESRGSVVFKFGGHSFEGIIQNWSDSYISVELDEDISGLQKTRGTLTVTNHVGLEANWSIMFEPVIEILLFVSDELDAPCNPTGVGVLDAAICYFTPGGVVKKYTLHDWILINGWTVDSAWIEECGIEGGCRYITKPSSGGVNAKSYISVHTGATASSRFPACCIEHFTIKGPRGFDYK